jgi:tyrosinase
VPFTCANSPIADLLIPGYTYPDINTVSINTALPTDPDLRLAQRNVYIGKLRAHFSNPSTIRRPNPIFKKPEMDVPSGYDLIPDYRRFAVEVTLASHAFHGSYWLELVCKGEVVGSFAVLSRGDDTHCAACIARNDAGAKVRGVIDIPEDVVINLTTDVSDPDVVIKSLKEGISARIVGPGGAPLAYAESHNGETRSPPLKSENVPSLKLLTAAGAAMTLEQTDTPVQFFNWFEHGDLLDDAPWTTA